MSAAQLAQWEKIWPEMLQQARNQAKEGKINVEALENIAKVGGVEAGKPEASSPYSSNSSAGIKMNIDKETGEIKQPFFKTPTTTTPTQRAIALVLHVQIHRKLNRVPRRKPISTPSWIGS